MHAATGPPTSTGERLAVIHDTWWSGRTSTAIRWSASTSRASAIVDYVSKLRESDRVVVQRDKGTGSLECDGYVGVFSFKDLQVDPTARSRCG